MLVVRRVRRRVAPAAIAVVAALASLSLLCQGAVAGGASTAASAVSHASLWQALGGRVRCGLALTTKPPSQILCEARAIPAPKGSNPMEGDSGFAFLGRTRRPTVARLSQNTWVGAESSPLRQVFVRLGAGRTWSSRQLRITCSIGRRSVRCTNRSAHGFVLTRSSYRAF
jgi:hypothetical protein